MLKLMICDNRAQPLRPNCNWIFSNALGFVASGATCARNVRRFMSKLEQTGAGPFPAPRHSELSEVNREEDDTFRERREDNRCVTDGTSSTGIAPSGFRGFRPDETHANGRSETGETDVNAASDARGNFG